ncbi:hypothetical protein QYE76_023079 [Lolium multiflorum]|uniref:Reverse transcriptase Ty1/copia-type domain-containing protein n=1 Tax=Lolium multiflorum TaxID=4521 RepID=A0AAD8RC57_LOLMU|nr:hypothetical protein QYE76_023079 [Lolium multiflorum]
MSSVSNGSNSFAYNPWTGSPRHLPTPGLHRHAAPYAPAYHVAPPPYAPQQPAWDPDFAALQQAPAPGSSAGDSNWFMDTGASSHMAAHPDRWSPLLLRPLMVPGVDPLPRQVRRLQALELGLGHCLVVLAAPLSSGSGAASPPSGSPSSHVSGDPTPTPAPTPASTPPSPSSLSSGAAPSSPGDALAGFIHLDAACVALEPQLGRRAVLLGDAVSGSAPPPRATATGPSRAPVRIHWLAAMQDEFDALQRNQTWTLVPRPPHANSITGKWVFKHKFHPDGTLDRHKARWVVRGFRQRAASTSPTPSPVVKPETIRTVLQLAVSRAWPVHQMDVSNAFLHGHLEEQVFCQQPTGFIDSAHPDHVCLLSRSLYGLKQAPRACSTDLLRQITERLRAEYALKDLGPLHYFLGIEVVRRTDGFFLHQRKYAHELLDRAGMLNCKPAATPVDTKSKLSATDGSLATDASFYRSIVGALQYLTLTRPELQYAVQQLTRSNNEAQQGEDDHLATAMDPWSRGELLTHHSEAIMAMKSPPEMNPLSGRCRRRSPESPEMGFAARVPEGFPYRGSRRGFATEALSRRKGNGGHTRARGGARRGLGRAALSWLPRGPTSLSLRSSGSFVQK